MDTSVIDSAEQRVGKETVRSRTDKPDQIQIFQADIYRQTDKPDQSQNLKNQAENMKRIASKTKPATIKGAKKDNKSKG